MFVLITYDVSTIDKAGMRRLRRVAQACEDYGQRVQDSVFECQLDLRRWVVLRERLLGEIDIAEDSLRFYFLDADTRVENHGLKRPVDFSAPLIY